MSVRAQVTGRLGLLAVAALLPSLGGCDGPAAEAATSTAYLDAIVEAAPDAAGGSVSERLWTWETDVDMSCGDPSPDGRMVSLADWVTGDLGVWEAANDSVRHVTHKGGWSPDESFTDCSTFSPDGERIAYQWYHMDEERRTWIELRVVDVEGSGEPRVLVQMPLGDVIEPTDWGSAGILATTWLPQRAVGFWAADTSRAGARARSEPGDSRPVSRIVVVDPDDGDVRVVLESEDPLLEPTFSPDGRTVAYRRSDEIHLLALNGGNERETGAEGARILGWPRRGESLYYSDAEGDIRVLNVVGDRPVGEPRQVRRDGLGRGIGTSDDALFSGVRVDARRVRVEPIDGHGRSVGEPKPIAPLPGELEGRLSGSRSRYPAWSPDGQTLAYIRGRDRIHVTSPGGRRLRELRVDGRIWDLEWGPDGESLWYRTNAPRKRVLTRYDFGTGEEVEVMPLQGHWSLDPVRSVVYERRQFWDGRPSGIWAVNYETGEERLVVEVAEEPIVMRVDASPDGSQLAYFSVDSSGSAHRLLIVPVEGGTPREIHRVVRPASVATFPVQPHWSSDGQRVFYVRIVSADFRERVLESVSIDGGEPRVLAEFDNYPGDLDLHPEAGWMAYVAGRDRFELWKTEVGAGGR